MNDVLITGADRGLGYCLCETFLNCGDRVFAGRFNGEYHLLESLKERFSERLYLITMDVGSGESLRAAAKEVGALTEDRYID